jgi:hypothetical protein
VKAFEESLLSPVERILERHCNEVGEHVQDARIAVLEAVASRLGGFDLGEYHALVGGCDRADLAASTTVGLKVLNALQKIPIHPSLALTALARPSLKTAERRRTGAYYTDFRLASYLCSRLAAGSETTVLDPASGTGILLVALGLELCGTDSQARARYVRSQVHAADLSRDALRGAALSLASLTSDVDAVAEMLPRLRCLDSLLQGRAAWADVAPGGFDVVVGNPPWEKLKVNRHEFLAGADQREHYGADRILQPDLELALADERERLARYSELVHAELGMQGSGEPDLFKAFTELAITLAAPDGEIGLLLPAGLIRSQGTEDLRRLLFTSTTKLYFTVFENRARFFAIDTRFKFLALIAKKSGAGGVSRLAVAHASADGAEVAATRPVRIGRATLASIRPDLSLPEIRDRAEWRLFRRMAGNGQPLGSDDGMWQPRIIREADMTRDRFMFSRSASVGRVPLIEGRMVHQHRFGAKAYVSGTGRRALWMPLPPGTGRVEPQFWIDPRELRSEIRSRSECPRVGFCDVTGQTNERTLLAARIPGGVVCGNKVPTITFQDGAADAAVGDALQFLWLAMANSLPLDWFARRVVTTSVNYFLLLALPFPRLDLDSPAARKLIALARSLDAADRGLASPDAWSLAELRAEIDIRVAAAYGLDYFDLQLILKDFTLLDRGQPPLPGERRSTVTRDFLLTRAAAFWSTNGDRVGERMALAREMGAVPYWPSEFGTFHPGHDEEPEEAGYG